MAKTIDTNISSRGRFASLILALLFAIIFGFFMAMGLLTEQSTTTGGISDNFYKMSYVCGMAGSIAAILTWWLSHLVGGHKTPNRFLFAFMLLSMVFILAGGALTAKYGMVNMGEAGPDYQVGRYQDFYLLLVDGVKSFMQFLVMPKLRFMMLALLPVGAFFIAMFGPRRSS